MILRELQALLADIYDVPVAHDVCDFLVTDLADFPGVVSGRRNDEQLLVACDGDELSLGLYLDAQVLERLSIADPINELNAGNLADCWTALEGVSHFHYLAYHAGYDRDVSRLELETQAEIDKYIVTLSLLQRQSPEHFPLELHSILFANAQVDSSLPAARAVLYRHANECAARYCRRLESLLRRRAEAARQEAAAELRRFYRLSGTSKQTQLSRCA